jgi:hypothetical protein
MTTDGSLAVARWVQIRATVCVPVVVDPMRPTATRLAALLSGRNAWVIRTTG